MASRGERFRLGFRLALGGLRAWTVADVAEAEALAIAEERLAADLPALLAPYRGGLAPRLGGTYHPSKAGQGAAEGKERAAASPATREITAVGERQRG